MPNELTYFTVIGNFYDSEAAASDSTSSDMQFLPINATVIFTARLSPGTVIQISDLDLGNDTSGNATLALPPVPARIINGQLDTINQSQSAGVQLIANSAVLGLSTLIYDVTFTGVEYAESAQMLSNFAFTAPTTATTVDLGDPTLTRLAYDPTGY